MAKKLIFNAETNQEEFIDVIDEVITNEDLEILKEQKLNDIMSLYKAVITSGFSSSANGSLVTYGYSQQDQLNYSKIANTFALNLNKTTTIIGSVSHGVVTLTKEQFIIFMGDAETHETNLYIKRKDLENKVTTALTKEELDIINVSLI